MWINKLKQWRDFLHAYFCYQLFITPIPMPIEKEYRDFAERACEFIIKHRTTSIKKSSPRPHVIHHFAQPDNPNAKKILITHGWMSRAAYMVRLIRELHGQGYEVYALDFPAHGEAKGYQLTWVDAVLVLKEVLNEIGPFFAVIGHSFGGSMLLNTLNLAYQIPDFELQNIPEHLILIASPTSMRTPINKLAKRLKLSGKSYLYLRQLFRRYAFTKIENLNFRNFIANGNIPVLCVHGSNDLTISPQESKIFCQRYQYASLAIIPGVDHVDVLIDPRVEKAIGNFLHHQSNVLR